MIKHSETKLEQYSIIPYDGFELRIKNVKIAQHRANAEEGYYIWDEYRKQRMAEVVIYKRIFDDEGELLEEPIYDIHEYYVCNDADGYKTKLSSPYPYEN